MTFIALDIQKNYMLQQQSSLQFRQLCISDNKQFAQQGMALEQQKSAANVAAGGQPIDTSTGAYAVYYAQDQLFTQQMASIESQLKALTAQIETFGKAVDNNIKNGCKLNIGA